MKVSDSFDEHDKETAMAKITDAASRRVTLATPVYIVQTRPWFEFRFVHRGGSHRIQPPRAPPWLFESPSSSRVR